MIPIISLVSVANVAIWLGASVFFTFFAGPVFFTGELKAIIPPPYNGIAAQFVIQRFFYLQYICGGLAVAHMVAEWIYLGRPIERVMGGILVTVVGLGLLGGFWLQPKLKHLHSVKYGVRSTPAVQAEAASSFKVWHGVSQFFNLIVLGGIGVYSWKILKAPGPTRFASTTRYRS